MAARSHPPSLPGALPACVSSAPSLLTARSPAMAARPALPSPPRAIPLPVGRPRAVHDRTAHGEAGAQTRQWPVKGHGGGRPARGHGGGRRAPHRNPAARQRRAPPPRAVNETSSSEYLRFGSPAAGSALNLGGSTPSLAGSASAHSPFLQPPPSRTPAYGCGRGRCQARRLRPPATALTRAGCGLRRPSCPAAGASQEWPRGCCLTRSAPSLADPPAIARAGLIPGFLLSALFDVVVFFLSGLSAVRHCCPPRTPESQTTKADLGGSTPMLFKTFTGKELLDSSAKARKGRLLHHGVSGSHYVSSPAPPHDSDVLIMCCFCPPSIAREKICRCFGPVPHKSKSVLIQVKRYTRVHK
ncbi:uncharacterized protein LOC120712218 isoform X6 [Panicum virgatum]|uniref:uncharacterized protein LOC120712218 isoform X6 n=1 Tax=Panicum virgatum TaxID=38727 RepID=UPI0019D57539|nr:uncharacterized protein LOC120712218 isoform X6 [Panicum virgatum]